MMTMMMIMTMTERAEQEGAGRLKLLNSSACGSCHGGGRTGSGCAHRSRQGLMMMMMMMM